MNKLTGTITSVALFSVILALSACGATPKAINTAQDDPREIDEVPNDDVMEAPEPQTAANDPGGLGTIIYDGGTRTKQCKRQRRTGSHLFRVGCSDPDSGSQPVRSGTYDDLDWLTQ